MKCAPCLEMLLMTNDNASSLKRFRFGPRLPQDDLSQRIRDRLETLVPRPAVRHQRQRRVLVPRKAHRFLDAGPGRGAPAITEQPLPTFLARLDRSDTVALV